jgi:hypothetical protein
VPYLEAISAPFKTSSRYVMSPADLAKKYPTSAKIADQIQAPKAVKSVNSPSGILAIPAGIEIS